MDQHQTYARHKERVQSALRADTNGFQDLLKTVPFQ